MKPYYEESGIQIFHGDCKEVLQSINIIADLVLTDPPYGINRDKGMGCKGKDINGKQRSIRKYDGSWDSELACETVIRHLKSCAPMMILWGGNYYADALGSSSKWLVWDKEQPMPSYSQAELAWTNLPGESIKMFRQCAAGMMAVEKERFHPTQKPIALMKWCISLCEDLNRGVFDPFCGSGTTLIAAKSFGFPAVGIEREEHYCEIAANRLRQSVLNFEEAV